ncbi:putative oxidoreductase,short chain dehydrogenase [Xylariales sp. PMI_506]|nr:putative oxidoreductase,short chain dehydrogenase [Xylariales sp. PMI_506]
MGISVFSWILYATGLVGVGRVLLGVVRLARIHLLPSRLDRYAHTSRDGKPAWAMVTGATDGVGLALVRELAAQGFNVVLHGRNPQKLAGVRDALQAQHPALSFRIVVAEATTVACKNCLPQADGAQPPADTTTGRPGPTNFDAIRDALEDINLTLLVNNAGGGTRKPTFATLEESAANALIENISFNAMFPMYLTRALLPNLKRNSPSAVINISSAADAGYPLIYSYSCSKQFLMTGTRVLGLEMALEGRAGGSSGVEFLGARLGRVSSTSFIRDPPTLFTPSAAAVAKSILAKVGYGHGIVDGHWPFALQNVMVNSIPAGMFDRMIVRVMIQEKEADLAKDKAQ